MTWPVKVNADLDTGAVVVTVVTGPALRTVTHLRTAVLNAKEQRPTGVVLDFTALARGWIMILLLLAGDVLSRSPVRMMVCVPHNGRTLFAFVSGLAVYPRLQDCLARLPGGGVPAGNRRQVRLTPSLQSPAAARALLAEATSGWCLDHLRPAAELVLTELVNNAIEHARTGLVISVIRMDGWLRVAVWDADPNPPVPTTSIGDQASLLALGGRGLHLIDAVATSWGYVTAPQEKVVWAHITRAAVEDDE